MRFARNFAIAALTLSLCSSAFAKDQWTEVRSKNFLLIGNGAEKDIRRVAESLEQFRESLGRLLPNFNLKSSIPTNVVVFKDKASFRPFQPLRKGKIDDGVAGYFQSGQDVNYITLTTGGTDASTFATIFHEYVHFIIDNNFGRANVPHWFNEGLAGYYQTFEISGEDRIKLGMPQFQHLRILRKSRLLPLDQLLHSTNQGIHDVGGHSRDMFYAQSWALVHYINHTGRANALEKFLKSVIAGTLPQPAFEAAFATTYAQMAKDLERYIAGDNFTYLNIKFKQTLAANQIASKPLGDAAASAYLGDLLYRTSRDDDAAPYLAEALRLDPSSNFALTTLAMVKVRQRKFDEARPLFEKVIAAKPAHYAPYYQYAQLLSRDARDEFGFVYKIEKSNLDRMRRVLRRAIELNPQFIESYDLFAFVCLMAGEDLDEAMAALSSALKIEPGEERLLLRVADIQARQNKLDEAQATAEKLAAATLNPEIKVRTANILANVRQLRAIAVQNAAARITFERTAAAITPIKHIEGVTKPTEAELKRQEEDARMRMLNNGVDPLAAGHQRVRGRILQVECRRGTITFRVNSDAGPLNFSAKDFSSLRLRTIEAAARSAVVGCDSNLSKFDTLITYTAPKNKAFAGEVVGLEFIPADFRFMTAAEMADDKLIVYDEHDTSIKTSTIMLSGESPDVASGGRQTMIQAIKDVLRPAGPGELRTFGYVETIECTGNSFILNLRTEVGGLLRLSTTSMQNVRIAYFTPDLGGGGSFGCDMKPVEYPAVVSYLDKPDAKTKSNGDVLSLEFVPKGFTFP